MKRRNFFGVAVASIAGLFALSRSEAAPPAPTHSPLRIEAVGPRVWTYNGVTILEETETRRLESIGVAEEIDGMMRVTIVYHGKPGKGPYLKAP